MSYLQVILEQLVDSNGHNTEATPPRRQYVEMNSRYIHALKETREWSFLLSFHGRLSCHRRSASVSLEAPQGRLWCRDRWRTLPLLHSLMNIQRYLLYHRHSSGHMISQPQPTKTRECVVCMESSPQSPSFRHSPSFRLVNMIIHTLSQLEPLPTPNYPTNTEPTWLVIGTLGQRHAWSAWEIQLGLWWIIHEKRQLWWIVEAKLQRHNTNVRLVYCFIY